MIAQHFEKTAANTHENMLKNSEVLERVLHALLYTPSNLTNAYKMR